ncbi:putative reductase [Podospora fimiseda]|uniref:Reductase n=1 Tax=Podospora fimiseda TaxID=252190 RepID=A0AAN7BM04_9PEZI|nr:putative reductase [Podospora fimiseda]
MSSSNLHAASLFSVNGMVAVITGGGTGIGLTMARTLASNGASKIYLLGRRLQVLQNAAKEHPSIFHPIQCDVTSVSSLQSAVDTITAETGYINLLVANSGVLGPLSGWDPSNQNISEIRKNLFTQHTLDTMTQTMHVNVSGAFFSIIAFLELLDAGNKSAIQGKGFGRPDKPGSDVPSIQSQVIVTSSIAAYSRMAASKPAYAASKAAILHLTKQASTNLARYGIRANALAPGLFPSELASGLIGSRDAGKESYDDPKFIPARKFGGDEEIAGLILYLAGRPGSYCNGSVFVADGGRLSVMLGSY